jgi:hypothetical protein
MRSSTVHSFFNSTHCRDGKKEILIATKREYLEVLNAKGEKEKGWPMILPSVSLQSSPLLYDINNDTKEDVIIVTEDGDIVFVSQEGVPYYGKTLKVPPLKVPKDWYHGLDLPNIHASLSLSNSKEQSSYSSSSPSKAKGRRLLQMDELDAQVHSPLLHHCTLDTYLHSGYISSLWLSSL